MTSKGSSSRHMKSMKNDSSKKTISIDLFEDKMENEASVDSLILSSSKDNNSKEMSSKKNDEEIEHGSPQPRRVETKLSVI